MTERDASSAFPILIGDIGGTNARFAILSDATSDPVHFPTVHVQDFETLEDAIRKGVLDRAAAAPVSAILAVAGPIEGSEIRFTNSPWVVRPNVLISDLGMSDVLVINDFEAQALAVASLGEEFREQIGGTETASPATRIVLGPGTGLGVAGLLYDGARWTPVPGEGGHVDLGPRSARDLEIWPHLATVEGRVSAEQVLSGRGLKNLYLAICEADGVSPVCQEPADISTAGLAGTNACAAEAVSLFATYLGRVAGDMALVFMAHGGVYLSGGIPEKILPALKHPSFRQSFEDKAPHSHLLKELPVYVVTHPLAALAGLSDYARNVQGFGLSTTGRRWRR